MLSEGRNITFNIILSLSWKKEKRSRRTQFQFTGRHNEKMESSHVLIDEYYITGCDDSLWNV